MNMRLFAHKGLAPRLLAGAACGSALLAVFLTLPLQPAPAAAESGFAVVELFTSEGCSSCPPADRQLAELAREADKSGAAVYCLAFHVDYWNQLGWTDRFSDAAFTQRQRRYVQRLGASAPYTPQMVINGQTELVGSQGALARAAVADALARPAAAQLELLIHPSSTARQLAVGIVVAPAAVETDDRVHVALVELGLTSDVTSGENAGRRLEHTGLVRSFVTAPANTAGPIKLNVPPDARLKHCRVIGWLQSESTLAIRAASGQKIPTGLVSR